jgi:hypothetical protein
MVWLLPNAWWIYYNWPGIQSWVFIIMSATCVAGWIRWAADAEHHRKTFESLQADNRIFRLAWQKSQDKIIALKKEIEEKP